MPVLRKSVPYYVRSQTHKQVTMLIVPLVSLQGNLLRRMHALKIDHLEWTVWEHREVALVTVSIEVASTKVFLKHA